MKNVEKRCTFANSSTVVRITAHMSFVFILNCFPTQIDNFVCRDSNVTWVALGSLPVHVALMLLYQRLVTLSLRAIKSPHPSADYVVFFWVLSLLFWPLDDIEFTPVWAQIRTFKLWTFSNRISRHNALRSISFFLLIKSWNDNTFLSDTLRCWESTVFIFEMWQ